MLQARVAKSKNHCTGNMTNQVAAKRLAKFPCGHLDAKDIQTNVKNFPPPTQLPAKV
jgi:hypothetical protein